VELQGAKQRFESQGIKLAAISYDSESILRDFAERHKIDFPLLADPESKVIRSFRVLNETATGRAKGVALPGFVYIDANGVIREKYFEEDYEQRFTANNVIAKMFPELVEESSHKVRAPHLQLKLAQSDRSAFPGSRVSLVMEVGLPAGTHVYAPNAYGYKPISLAVQPSEDVRVTTASYPQAKILYLEAINEQVPVFEGNFQIAQDVTISSSKSMLASLGASGRTLRVAGELRYQACDKRICFPPTHVPVCWQLRVLPLDYQRSPEAIRHK
jgi:hypothetical protein